jgi:endonuclease/exonuclease/phosphatase family metal-dependent hydrolase
MGLYRRSRRAGAVAALIAAMVAGLVSPSVAADDPPPPPSFVVGSFNILGHGHTEPGGKRAGMADGVTRMAWTLQLLQRHDIAVIGMQEFQREQREYFTTAQTQYQVWPGNDHPNRYKQNVVAWRRAQFDFVSGFTFTIPYRNNFMAPQPVVRLREKTTGRQFYVMSVHNIPGRTAEAIAKRAEGLRIEIAVTKGLLADRVPVFVTGDFNDRQSTFCRFTQARTMVAAAGGSNIDGVCTPPPASIARIDWVFGSRATQRFSDYAFIRSPLVIETSDHPLIVSRTTFR